MKKYWKELTDKEKLQVYTEICKSELYQEILDKNGSGWCTEFSETFMMYKGAEIENGELITVERFKEIMLVKLKNLL
ncbi:hypothetical protein [Fusobacterium polymorphum]|uniref:hypothetical protein n=1 Tax=Fusobacterium nucleatum subsp. polymorphum TaxID=76857 RepID=UPI0030088321